MKKIVFLLAVVLFSLSACSKFQKIVKNENWQVRYKAALDYYEKGDYYRAGALLEDLVPILAGTIEAEKARFYFAYCYFKQGQYTLSAHHFKQFHDTYSRSDFAEESLYMHCYSQYMDTPNYNLDQSNTNTAINAFQEFINRYPSSRYAQQSSTLILDLRNKLEQKAFALARLYQKLVDYRYEYTKSAVIAYENFRKDFPDSKLQEEAAYRKIEAQYELANKSYYAKQKERYEEVLTMYQYFIEKYPKSKFLKDAEQVFDNAQKRLRAFQLASQKNSSLEPNTGK